MRTRAVVLSPTMSFVSNPALDQVRLQLQVKDNIIRNLAEELSDAKQALTIREQWWRDQFSSAQQEHDAAQQEALDDGTPPLPPPSAASSSASLEKALTATSSSENQAREEAAHLRGELARLQERSEALLRESTALARREREHRLVEEELARQAEMAETKAAEANRQVCEEQERRREEEERRRDAEERRREAEERRREAEEKLENLQDLEGALVAAREQEGALEGELSAVQEEARGWRDEMERMSAELEQGLVREEKLREGMVLLVRSINLWLCGVSVLSVPVPSFVLARTPKIFVSSSHTPKNSASPHDEERTESQPYGFWNVRCRDGGGSK